MRKVLTIAVLLGLTEGFMHLLAPDESGAQSGESSTAFAVRLAIYAIAFLLCLVNLGEILRVCRRFVWLPVLLGLAVLSTVWSELPIDTLRHCGSLLVTTLFGIHLATYYGRRGLAGLIAWTMLIVTLCSIGFVLFLPHYGVATDPTHFGDWQGIFRHKNMLGMFMVLSTVVFLTVDLHGTLRIFRWVLVLASAAMVVLSGSATSQVVLVAVLLSIYATRIVGSLSRSYPASRRGSLLAAISLLFMLVASEAVVCVPEVLGALKRDPTLTGRTEVWQVLLPAISLHPLLGYGFGAFWRGVEGTQAVARMPFEVVFAHNGFLEVLLQLGSCGLILYGLMYSQSMKRAITVAMQNTNSERLWPLGYLMFMLLFNVTESTWLDNNIFWVLFVSIGTSMALGRYYEDARRQAGARVPRRSSAASFPWVPSA